MDFNKFIINELEELLEYYEGEKSNNGRVINTIIGSINVVYSDEYLKSNIKKRMLQDVEKYADKLDGDKKIKFLEDNTPCEFDSINMWISNNLFIEVCSLIEGCILNIITIRKYLENEREFKSDKNDKFKSKYMKFASKDMSNGRKYDTINTSLDEFGFEDLFNDGSELEKNKYLFKYFYILRNCMVHNLKKTNNKLIDIQNKVINKLNDLSLRIYTEYEYINLRTEDINTIIPILRRVNELLIIGIINDCSKVMDCESIENFKRYYERITID